MDGVAEGGLRIAAAVKREAPRPGGCISFICHSLGGIYARHAIRLLEAEGWFATSGVRAANFVTTACPHLGIMELGGFWRFWIGFLPLGETINDLALQSCVVRNLTDDFAMRSLQRFERRAVYGNVDDDMWVRSCTALLTAAPPSLGEDLPPGVPQELLEVPTDDELGAFPDEQRSVVSDMLGRLTQLEWERYAVYFPYSLWTGAAHSKICNHKDRDTANCGVHVVFHICTSFIDLPAVN